MTDTDRQPNVLFIITDQHRADHVGFMGNDVVQTPNLDGIASRGTVFERTFVSNPVCMPNRSTIVTGRMPSAHGVIFNDRSLDWGAGTGDRVMGSMRAPMPYPPARPRSRLRSSVRPPARCSRSNIMDSRRTCSNPTAQDGRCSSGDLRPI